jgi:hypothetical protein
MVIEYYYRVKIIVPRADGSFQTPDLVRVCNQVKLKAVFVPQSGVPVVNGVVNGASVQFLRNDLARVGREPVVAVLPVRKHGERKVFIVYVGGQIRKEPRRLLIFGGFLGFAAGFGVKYLRGIVCFLGAREQGAHAHRRDKYKHYNFSHTLTLLTYFT